MRPKIYAAQEPSIKIEEGVWAPKGLDFSSAHEFGELLFVWPPMDSYLFSRRKLEERALEAARNYDDTRDYILALGSPTLIGLLGWAIGKEGKKFRILEWTKATQTYYATLVEPQKGAA